MHSVFYEFFYIVHFKKKYLYQATLEYIMMSTTRNIAHNTECEGNKGNLLLIN